MFTKLEDHQERIVFVVTQGCVDCHGEGIEEIETPAGILEARKKIRSICGCVQSFPAEDLIHLDVDYFARRT